MEWDTAKRLVQDAENGSSPQRWQVVSSGAESRNVPAVMGRFVKGDTGGGSHIEMRHYLPCYLR